MSVRLAYESVGDGPALVLLHPVGLDRSFWPPLLPQAAARQRVIAVDLAGHGESPPAPAGRDVAAYAADVLALLDELGLEAVTLLGLSFGGMIAQELAVTAPQRVARLIVGACGTHIPEAARAAVRARGTAALTGGMDAVIEATLARWFTAPFLAAPEVGRVRARLAANRPEDWAAGWHAISAFDVAARLGQVRRPALVIAGEHDAGTAVPATRAIAEAIAGAEFVLLEGAPHMMQIECAARFTARVLAYLER
jgi:3-oxoadipate enol-lactonase